MLVATGSNPMGYRRQALADELRVGRRLIPADPADRVIFFACRVGPRPPCGRSGLAGLILEPLDDLFPATDHCFPLSGEERTRCEQRPCGGSSKPAMLAQKTAGAMLGSWKCFQYFRSRYPP